MACSCCGPIGCKCKILNDPNAETESFTTYPFSYSFYYHMGPWIHRKYPEPLFEGMWDFNNGIHVGSNVVYYPDGRVKFSGDTSGYSRKGIPAGQAYGGWLVEDSNGDTSEYWRTGQSVSNSFTIFYLEEKQDAVNRECQLWIKFKKSIGYNVYTGWQISDFYGEKMIHSIKWNEPFESEIIVEIPGTDFNGPDSVEIKYFCIDPCNLINNPTISTWTLSGQADWITESEVQFPLDYCKSYGKYNGIVEFINENCSTPSSKTNNKAEKVFFTSYVSCGYQYGFVCTFTGAAGFQCEAPLGPCVPQNYYPPDPYKCCGNIFGGYTKQPDGTVVCGYLSQIIPWSSYVDDPYNRHIINGKTVQFNGVWQNNPENYKQTYNCSTLKSFTTPYVLYKSGTVQISGV